MPNVLEKIEQLKQKFSFKNKEEEKEFYQKNSYLFATTSASLLRLMPHIPYTQHKSIFKKLLYNISLLDIEEQNPTSFAPHFEVIDKNNILEQARNGKPFLFCCFHLGAYSLLPTLFTYKNLEFGFLLNEKLDKRKSDKFLEAHQTLCNYLKNTKPSFRGSAMKLINVEDKKGIWEAIRALKNGTSLVIYADGNTGAKLSNLQNLVEIEFGGEKLLVRKGAAFLSYICNVPIVPVITSRALQDNPNHLKRTFEFLPAIYPSTNTTKTSEKQLAKQEFAAQTMQKLYDILEAEIFQSDIKRISEWEGWIFINKLFKQLHKTLPIKKVEHQLEKKDTTTYIFHEERFTLIENRQDATKNMLFDKFTYRFFPASELLCQIITYFSEPKKLYLSNSSDRNTVVDSNSPNSTTTIDISTLYVDSKLQLSKTLVSLSALEKLIEKNILVQFK